MPEASHVLLVHCLYYMSCHFISYLTRCLRYRRSHRAIRDAEMPEASHVVIVYCFCISYLTRDWGAGGAISFSTRRTRLRVATRGAPSACSSKAPPLDSGSSSVMALSLGTAPHTFNQGPCLPCTQKQTSTLRAFVTSTSGSPSVCFHVFCLLQLSLCIACSFSFVLSQHAFACLL